MRRTSSMQMRDTWAGGMAGRAEPRRNPVLARLGGPGGYYNVGNAVALTAGLAVQVAASLDAGGEGMEAVVRAARAYLFGSPGATSLTVSILIFFVSGEMYHRAWARGAPPDERANWWGDVLSGVAAVVLTAALVAFGDAVLALLSGVMLAAGKFGSALVPGSRASRDAWRLLPLLSRLPALATLALQIVRLAGGGAGAGEMVMPVVMFGCFLLWLRADLLLLAGERAEVPRR